MYQIKRQTAFDYILVLNFECTCQKEVQLNCQEIIQFPLVIIDVQKKEILKSQFHHYIKPTVNPNLTSFCKDLTKITQEQVNSGITIQEALQKCDEFLVENQIIGSRFTFVTLANFDFSALNSQAEYKGFECAQYLKQYINIKEYYKEFYKMKSLTKSLEEMLQQMKLQFEGTLHSGIDDTQNIAQMVIKFLELGGIFENKDVKQVMPRNDIKNPKIPFQEQKKHDNIDQLQDKSSDDASEYEFLLVLDFECTCDKGIQLECQEIIQFPVMIIDVNQMEVSKSVFHYYIQPSINTKLTDFCKDLTQITQDQVDQGIYLDAALKEFNNFLNENKINDKKFTFVTCGNFDIGALRKEVAFKKLDLPQYFNEFINIQEFYQNFYNQQNEPRGMMSMLEDLQIKHVGTHHSGIDDVRNITNIVLRLLNEGAKFKSNSSLDKKQEDAISKISKFFQKRRGQQKDQIKEGEGVIINPNSLQQIPSVNSKPIKYLIVFDLEYTCGRGIDILSEIIEFPLLILDVQKASIIDTFHSYVKPVVNPKITPFCSQLTGITQEKVDQAPTLPVVLQNIDKFLGQYIDNQDNGTEHSFVADIAGDIDHIYKESHQKNFKIKPYWSKRIALKTVFPLEEVKGQNVNQVGLKQFLQLYEVQFEGNHHSGLDDATNIAAVCIKLINQGYLFETCRNLPVIPVDDGNPLTHVLFIYPQYKKGTLDAISIGALLCQNSGSGKKKLKPIPFYDQFEQKGPKSKDYINFIIKKIRELQINEQDIAIVFSPPTRASNFLEEIYYYFYDRLPRYFGSFINIMGPLNNQRVKEGKRVFRNYQDALREADVNEGEKFYSLRICKEMLNIVETYNICFTSSDKVRFMRRTCFQVEQN